MSIFKKSLAYGKQDALNLLSTKATLALYREAGTMEMSEKFRSAYRHELFMLVQEMAKREWGESTTVDDFSIPGKFIIRSGKKEEVI